MEQPASLGESRVERKERTRRAILDAALALSAPTGMASLSLRQVAKEVGIVPTAFYRHYASIDDLGLALVDESFVALREMLRDVRRGNPTPAEIIGKSVHVLAQHVLDRRDLFGFITRERIGGATVVREAVRHQLELFERELATDLAQLLQAPQWSGSDIRVLASLIVTALVATTERLVASDGRAGAARQILEQAETQLRMVVVGAANWKSGSWDVTPDPRPRPPSLGSAGAP